MLSCIRIDYSFYNKRKWPVKISNLLNLLELDANHFEYFKQIFVIDSM